MASILDISETLLENFVGLSHPEHAAHPNIEFNNEEENLCKDLLDPLNSLASPSVSPLNVAAHHVGQNFGVSGYTNFDTDDISCGYIMEVEQAAPDELTSQTGQNLDGLGCVNYDSGWSSSNIDCNVVGGSVMRAEQAAPDTSSCNFNWNDGGDTMQAEQAAPCEITSKIYQNLDGLRCINYESGWSSSSIDCDDGRKVMRAEPAAPDTSSCTFSWNDGGDAMQVEEALLRGITSKVCQNLDGLGCVNHDSGWSSSNASWNGMTKLNSLFDPLLKQKKSNSTLRELRLARKRKNSANDSNASVTGAHTLKVQHCEPDVDVAIYNHQLEELPSHERTAKPVDSTEQSGDVSQLDKCKVPLIGKGSEIPVKNASKGRRKPSTRYPCTKCGKQLSSKAYLAIHSRVHTGEMPYKCSQCDYASIGSSNLLRHQIVHSDARPFKCSTCNAAFKCKYILRNHEKIHSERECACDICKKLSLHGGSLMHHQNIHTTGKKTVRMQHVQ